MSTRILRIKEVIRLTGLSRSTIYKRVNSQTESFPTPVSLGGGLVGWVEEEVNAWILEAVQKRDEETH